VRLLFLSLLLCLLQGASAPAVGQSRQVPDWVVPVLRLVSTTHVEPTTGVVLSSGGLVLVPADFASPGDEIIVLDGGNDIIRHGRPARLERAFPELGLEVLQVDGLRRTAAPVAPASPDDGSTLRLRAFPPAEQIAEGAPPVNAETSVSVSPEGGVPTLAADAALPNVTGPLLDACGNLAGLSLAGGVQSLAATPATQYRWPAALRSVLTELQLPVTGTSCSAAAIAVDESPAAAVDEAEAAASEIELPAPQPMPPVTTEAVTEGPEEELAPPEISPGEPLIETLPPIERDVGEDEATPQPAIEERPARTWPWLVAGLVLLVGGAFLYRLRHDGRTASTLGQVGPPVDGGSAAEATGEDSEQPLTPPDSRLVLRGVLASGQPFEAAAAVSENAINVEIGRGGADLTIESASVSRRHARLNGTRDALTLTDLGSSNGSTINGVPCLEGEIMYLEPGDTIVLGDACFAVTIEAAAGSGRNA
jgi:hypothetical protein